MKEISYEAVSVIQALNSININLDRMCGILIIGFVMILFKSFHK